MPQFPQRPKPGEKFGVKAERPGDDLIAQTERLMAAVFGEATQRTSSLQTVFKAMDRPNARVVIELVWYADGGKHEVVLKERVGSRVRFYNPLGHGHQPAGTELTEGLKRRIEPDGSESCELMELDRLFRLGKARALISPPLT